MVYNPELGLVITDTCFLALYTLLFGFDIFVIVKYLIPLRMSSPYIIAFYFFLTVLLVCSIVEMWCRLFLS